MVLVVEASGGGWGAVETRRYASGGRFCPGDGNGGFSRGGGAEVAEGQFLLGGAFALRFGPRCVLVSLSPALLGHGLLLLLFLALLERRVGGWNRQRSARGGEAHGRVGGGMGGSFRGGA